MNTTGIVKYLKRFLGYLLRVLVNPANKMHKEEHTHTHKHPSNMSGRHLDRHTFFSSGTGDRFALGQSGVG